MPASWLSKGAVSPSIPGTVGLGWRWGGVKPFLRSPNVPCSRPGGGGGGGGYKDLKAAAAGRAPKSPPQTPGQPPALLRGLFSPSQSLE